ncbi:hydroxypyruvate isomerase family protein [Rhodovibrionaceae bacterium A322]
MLRFAANLSMLFGELPFLSRFQAAADAGFEGVEFLFPYDWDVQALAEVLQTAGLEQVLFNLPPGDWEAGERGMACVPGREAEFRESVDQALAYAAHLKTPRLHAMAGLKPDSSPQERLHETYVSNIAFAAERCEQAGVQLMIEPINPFNMPGYFLNDFDQACQVIEEIRLRGKAAPLLQFDLFHCARIHTDIAPWLNKTAALIGHYQIAGPDARHEPDDPSADWGREDYLALLKLAQKLTPDLWVGCEYLPAGNTREGLGWLDQARDVLA